VLKVLIVDDSAVARGVIARVLRASGLEVVGGAADAYAARDLIYATKPDILTLDLQMPRMDGLTFLSKLMAYTPMPVVVLSALTSQHRELAVKAMELGAVEVFPKPSGSNVEGELQRLASLLKRCAKAKPRQIKPLQPKDPFSQIPSSPAEAPLDTERVVALGASTGGTSALAEIVSALPAACPPLLIVQHMPAGFTSTFAKRLDSISKIRVLEARDGDPVLPGVALLAPGGQHMRLESRAGRLMVRCAEGPPVEHVCPSVDVLFESVALISGKRALGVLLTGMGRDGAQGMLAMRQAGARCIAQDEASSVVWGMPGEAVRLGAAEFEFPLSQIPFALCSLLRNPVAV
jgi:two-component system chemotaxis response regulator CheB